MEQLNLFDMMGEQPVEEIDAQKYIIDSINDMQGSYTPYQIFSDWVAMSAIAIQNACCLNVDEGWKKREAKYLQIASKYSNEQLRTLSNMTGALSMELEKGMRDVLGDIFMKAGCGSAKTGQFFTPYHLSYLTAQIAYDEKYKDIPEDEEILIHEPSSGGGGMMIGIIQTMVEKGINVHKRVKIIAQDLDWNGVYMTYVQLSLLGIRAIVRQGDSLQDGTFTEDRIFRTPAEMGAII